MANIDYLSEEELLLRLLQIGMDFDQIIYTDEYGLVFKKYTHAKSTYTTYTKIISFLNNFEKIAWKNLNNIVEISYGLELCRLETEENIHASFVLWGLSLTDIQLAREEGLLDRRNNIKRICAAFFNLWQNKLDETLRYLYAHPEQFDKGEQIGTLVSKSISSKEEQEINKITRSTDENNMTINVWHPNNEDNLMYSLADYRAGYDAAYISTNDILKEWNAVEKGLPLSKIVFVDGKGKGINFIRYSKEGTSTKTYDEMEILLIQWSKHRFKLFESALNKLLGSKFLEGNKFENRPYTKEEETIIVKEMTIWIIAKWEEWKSKSYAVYGRLMGYIAGHPIQFKENKLLTSSKKISVYEALRILRKAIDTKKNRTKTKTELARKITDTGKYLINNNEKYSASMLVNALIKADEKMKAKL